jgi:NTE family protein
LRPWAETATWCAILRLTGGGLLNGRQVVAFLQQLRIDQPIESCAQPYAAVATDLAIGREIWLQSGPIHKAVRTSIALPGTLSPANNDARIPPGSWTRDDEHLICRFSRCFVTCLKR